MKKLLTLALAALLTGCAAKIVKVEGDQLVNNRMSVRVTEAWNKVVLPNNPQPYETWTQEGLALDHLRLWAAVPSGKSLIELPSGATAEQKKRRLPTFEAGMQADQLVNLFEVMYANDGSIVAVNKVEPAQFAGEKGVRFEFTLTRKSDGVLLNGMGWVAVRNGELYAASFVAPRLAFFPRLAPKAQSVVQSAAIRG